MCVDPFERIWANILCKLTVLFDLPALGNSTGRGEMSPKHQHWNSFSGKALEWIFCAKSWAPLHPWCPGTDLSVTECNMRSLCADSWQLCSRFPLKIDNFVPHSQMMPSSWRGRSSASLCAAPVLFALWGGGRQGAQMTTANSRITFQQCLPSFPGGLF